MAVILKNDSLRAPEEQPEKPRAVLVSIDRCGYCGGRGRKHGRAGTPAGHRRRHCCRPHGAEPLRPGCPDTHRLRQSARAGGYVPQSGGVAGRV